jgi:hypothetical protein
VTAPACIHGCDGTWIDTPSGLMPCPRHSLAAHQEWAAGKYRPTGPTPAPPPEPDPATTEAGLAAARAALTPNRPTERHP